MYSPDLIGGKFNINPLAWNFFRVLLIRVLLSDPDPVLEKAWNRTRVLQFARSGPGVSRNTWFQIIGTKIIILTKVKYFDRIVQHI